MNPNNPQYADYGGRGIAVCERWLTFDNFLADMGAKPDGRLSIERVDNDKGYGPDNCKWATRKEQQRNRRVNRMLTYNGETLCLTDWATRLGLKQHSLSTRIDVYGWSVERALSTPKA